MEEHLLFNPSAWNVVHLPPRSEGSSSGSVYRSNSSRQSNWHSSSNTSSNQAARRSTSPPRASARASQASSAPRSNAGEEVNAEAGAREENDEMDREEQDGRSSAPTTGSMSDTSANGGLHTTRFEHVEDEHGHHILTGREGKLMRCEDEPIRTPGAVQGFGVLIAVEELEETLLVRQVSENSTEILGLSPNHLFSLECFTDSLPDTQAALLWDAIQFLSEPEVNESDSEENSPHVFLLSGWTAPNFAAEDDPDADKQGRKTWTCWCAIHRPVPTSTEGRPNNHSNTIIMEFELEKDIVHPLYPPASDFTPEATPTAEAPIISTNEPQDLQRRPASPFPQPGTVQVRPEDQTIPHMGLVGEENWMPSAEDILESTTSISKPLLALERLRRMTMRGETPAGGSAGSARARRRRGQDKAQPGSVGMMDIFAVMSQINEQLGAATDLETFLKTVVGVIKDLTQFHRVLVYQFDEVWNGQVVAELVDWSQTHDLYRRLHFPASDIPAQASHCAARELYAINKVRILYDREQSTARIVVRSKEDLDNPLNMTHSYLRAMSPIHLKYLGNMGVRASMSVSIMAFGVLWGLVACHSYGPHGMRVSFPVRQMLRLLSQSISKNIERLSYASRLHTRKLINTISSSNHPTGYIISNADDLLGLFDADYGILVIGEGAKILGPNQHGQEILIVAEYLRIKQFNSIQVSQAVTVDFPDLQISTGLEIVAGLLYVPLSTGGQDFMAFLRRGQPRDVHWAGKPYKEGATTDARLEPRKSFKTWSEKVAGRCRAWTDEQLETAGVMALVYGKFIEVWRQKETALQTTKLTNILLSNASHEVRTPLNHIINYLELALNGSLDGETRDNLSRSHAASKSLLFTINDLLDLTRLEIGGETAFNEPFDLQAEIIDATRIYKNEAERRKLRFTVDVSDGPSIVVGDAKKIRTVVQNLTANALKYTNKGGITIRSVTFQEPEGLRDERQTAVEIVVEDTGCGIASSKLESIFREFEQVESAEPKTSTEPGVGLGLAVVARIVEQLGGQLRVDSQVNEGSRFSFLIPLGLQGDGNSTSSAVSSQSSASSSLDKIDKRRSRAMSHTSASSKIDSLVEALSSSHMHPQVTTPEAQKELQPGTVDILGSATPLRPVRIDQFDLDKPTRSPPSYHRPTGIRLPSKASREALTPADPPSKPVLRILIVEDNELNSNMLAKRLTKDGHKIVQTLNGQEGLDKIAEDREFDAILMDIQMPILNGFEATERIREVEKKDAANGDPTSNRLVSFRLNGRIPIFAVSASLQEQQYEELKNYGLDGWILKPINFKRLSTIMHGIVDIHQRQSDLYRPGHIWENGGWLVPSPYLSPDSDALSP
ncbi:phytochrome-like protein [Schizophyllum commune Tattone D]|nr:phytochrome-like protein [Schizophyllum commune Tattone D]